ncbi:MAG: transporter [Candidatus Kapaibacterium sp.]|nr:MAG: transporter [Candidatus Kapabacteria bacterium]
MESLAVLGFVGVGLAWRWIRWLPASEQVRGIIAGAVFTAFLPALTFRSMVLHAPVGSVLWKIPLIAALSISVALVGGWLFLRRPGWSAPRRAALLLAAAFGNVTYLGIPILSAVVGVDRTFVAVLYDFAASTPLLWTLGVGVIALLTADTVSIQNVGRRLLVLPPLWAAGAGLLWQVIVGQQLPPLLDHLSAFAGALVIPLMMFVLGLSLRWEYLRRWRELVGVAILKLLVVPAVALMAALLLGLDNRTACATVLEAGMPTMMLVLVVAERFALDSEAVASAIVVTTLASAATLPLWWYLASIIT